LADRNWTRPFYHRKTESPGIALPFRQVPLPILMSLTPYGKLCTSHLGMPQFFGPGSHVRSFFKFPSLFYLPFSATLQKRSRFILPLVPSMKSLMVSLSPFCTASTRFPMSVLVSGSYRRLKAPVSPPFSLISPPRQDFTMP